MFVKGVRRTFCHRVGDYMNLLEVNREGLQWSLVEV